MTTAFGVLHSPMWKKIIRNSAIILAGVIFSRFFIFLSNTIIIRQLSISEYATFSLLTSILTWILVFSHLDLYAAVSRFVSESNAYNDSESIRSYYKNAILMGIALSMVGIVISIMLSYDQKVLAFPRIIFMMSLAPLALMTINDGFLKGFHHFKLSAVIDSSNGFARFLILAPALFILGRLNLDKILILSAIATLVPFLLSYLFVFSTVREPFHGSRVMLDTTVMSKLFHYSKWVCLTDLLSAGLFLFANFVICASSQEDLARFNIIILLYSVFQMFFGAITTVMIPHISHAVAKNRTIKILGIREIIFLVILASFFIAFIFIIPSKEKILTLLFGKSQYSDALNYVALLLISFPFRIASTTNRGIVQGLNRPRSIAIASVLTFIASALIFIVSYQRYGLLGSIMAINVSHLIEYFLTNRAARRVLETYKYDISRRAASLI